MNERKGVYTQSYRSVHKKGIRGEGLLDGSVAQPHPFPRHVHTSMDSSTRGKRDVDAAKAALFIVLFLEIGQPIEVVRQDGFAVVVAHDTCIFRWGRDEWWWRLEFFECGWCERGCAQEVHGSCVAFVGRFVRDVCCFGAGEAA